MVTEIERNKARSKKYFEEGWNEGNLDLFNELLARGFVLHQNGPEIRGIDAFKQLVISNRTGFPDLRFVIEEMMGVGRRVVIRWTAHGTQRGDWRGIPATGIEISSAGIDIHHHTNSEIVEIWNNSDTFGLYQQLRAIPPEHQRKWGQQLQNE